jgi:hypothetical protein
MNKNRKTQNDEALSYDPGGPDPEIAIKERQANSGRERMAREFEQYTSVSPELTAGDIDARWMEAEDSGAESPGGHVATPDQDNVDELGRAVGMEFEDNQELRTHDEVLSKRDRHRWELDRRSIKGDSL